MNDFHHAWKVSPKEAVDIQKQLRDKLIIEPYKNKENIKYIAGADVSLNRFSTTIYAGIIVLSYPDLTPVTHSVIKSETTFPYIPGLLSFREAPALIEAWEKLSIKPDVLVLDGQGIAHPRRLGIGAHIGVLLDVPTIGVAKSLLYGIYDEPEIKAGSFSYLYDKYIPGEKIGVVLRTKDKVKPVIISPGHKVNVEDALDIIKSTVRKYRLPEVTRLAHELVNEYRRTDV